MYHFIALLWNTDDPAARAEAMRLDQKLRRCALPWEDHVTTDGLSVFALQPSDPALRSYILPCDAGVVLGRLFRTDLCNPHLSGDGHIDEASAREIVRTAGRHLIHSFWGGYVALLRDHESRCAYAIRDSSGKIPCYYTRSGNVTILFADVADLAPLGLPSLTVNWEYLAAFIYSSQLQVRACGFKEIKEVLAGECLQLGRGVVRQTVLWDPRSVCRSQRIDNYEDAIAQLKEATQGCIDAWTRLYNPILLGLSGGFDSAVVLGCLHNSPFQPRVTCLHQFTAASHEDERGYARLAAARAGAPLLELPMDSAADQFDSRLLSGPKTPKPGVPHLLRLLETELINGVAASAGARTLWTGQGGDHVFLQTTGSASAGDYLATRGLRPGFIAALSDAARLSRQPYWFVLRSARKAGTASRPPPAVGRARETYFVAPAALPDNADAYVSHPWTLDAEDLPEGKQWQIRFLAEVANRHRPIPRLERAPQHAVLLSQPVVEVCVQIPTYLLLRGGRERGLARDAFADRVPPQIIRRRDKGSVMSHATELIRQSEEFVRELLLEGALADAGVIRSRDLEPYIVNGQPLREEHFLPLLACIAAEVWVRTNLISDARRLPALGELH
jgi:asparagine synthase (glutamine-hydrolysing)